MVSMSTLPAFSQENYAENIVGTWECGYSDNSEETYLGIINYHQGGDMTAVFSFGFQQGGVIFGKSLFLTLYAQTDWRVEGNILKEGELSDFKILSAVSGGLRVEEPELSEIRENIINITKEADRNDRGDRILHLDDENVIFKNVNDGEILTCSRLR